MLACVYGLVAAEAAFGLQSPSCFQKMRHVFVLVSRVYSFFSRPVGMLVVILMCFLVSGHFYLCYLATFVSGITMACIFKS